MKINSIYGLVRMQKIDKKMICELSTPSERARLELLIATFLFEIGPS